MNIAIWGTGSIGKYILKQIRNNEAYDVSYFVDSNRKLWGEKIEGVEVISPEQLQKIYHCNIAFLLVAFSNAISIYSQLVKMKIDKFGIVRNRVFEAQLKLDLDLFQDNNILWNDAPYLDKPILISLETNIVDDCNLNCRGCSHFSNLFERGTGVPFETYCRDLKHIAEHVYIQRFDMLGGEAILHPKIIEYIEYTRKMLPYSDIQIISNGLLIPKQTEAFFQCCAKNDITISISGYKPTLQIKDRIQNILKRYHIVYIFRESVNEFGKNIDLTGMVEQSEAVKKCRESRCTFLRDGKIYKCAFEALGNYFFSYFNLDIRLHGGIDIWDENLDWSLLAECLARTYEPVDACRYCGNEEKIAWEVTNSPALEDWITNQ
ncbi:MAG: 4Fe-4S cluster-binding domain-containing protein [Lachnospiraceae bacterium]|nr:4Fe-4S cluster-binding domain-containing protein [Lachnospiraceae bacterium]